MSAPQLKEIQDLVAQFSQLENLMINYNDLEDTIDSNNVESASIVVKDTSPGSVALRLEVDNSPLKKAVDDQQTIIITQLKGIAKDIKDKGAELKTYADSLNGN